MSMRRFMAGAAGGLAIALGAGHINTLQGQETSIYQSADQQFIGYLAAENLLEVRLSQAAETKATNASVKEFAQRMVTDHTTMQKQWMALASKNRLEFKADLSPQQVEQAERLAKVPGAEYDRAYMGLMVQNHRDYVNAFQNERRLAHSAEVRDLIDRDLTALQEHLTLAQQVGSQVGADVTGGIATGTDTTSAIPNLPPRADTTTVATQDVPPLERDDDDRRTDEERKRQGNIQADAEFIRDVNAGHFLEVRLGQLAQEKGRDADVKRFGQRMEKDHAALHKQWSDLRSRYGMSPQSGMGPNHRAKLEGLEKASGKAFDRQYMTLMIQNHQDYLNYWRKEGRAAETASVRQLVNRGISTLEEHQDMAKRIGKQVGVNAEAALAGRRISAQR